jgi:hypothetical protein
MARLMRFYKGGVTVESFAQLSYQRVRNLVRFMELVQEQQKAQRDH